MLSFPTYFGSAFVINLPERTDRLTQLTAEFNRLGWTLDSSGVEVFPACRFSQRAGFPSVGVRGAYQSHLTCLRRARDQDAQSVLVFEDDISFTSAMPSLTPFLIERLTTLKWDIVYFGHENTGEVAYASSDTPGASIRFEEWHSDVLGLHWYAVNGRVLRKLVDHLEEAAVGQEGDQVRGPMPVDGAFNIFRRLNPDIRTYIVTPKLGWQRPSRSDITPRMIDRVKILRPLTGMLRHIKRQMKSRA